MKQYEFPQVRRSQVGQNRCLNQYYIPIFGVNSNFAKSDLVSARVDRQWLLTESRLHCIPRSIFKNSTPYWYSLVHSTKFCDELREILRDSAIGNVEDILEQGESFDYDSFVLKAYIKPTIRRESKEGTYNGRFLESVITTNLQR